MENIEANDIIDPRQAATLLNIHEKTVRNMLLRGELPGVRFGKRWRLLKSAIHKMIPSTIATSNS
jgi:excisionase family DNA binding protein